MPAVGDVPLCALASCDAMRVQWSDGCTSYVCNPGHGVLCVVGRTCHYQLTELRCPHRSGVPCSSDAATTNGTPQAAAARSPTWPLASALLMRHADGGSTPQRVNVAKASKQHVRVDWLFIAR
jgi:hypothetical protein